MGDAKSSLGDTKSSLGDVKSSLGDAKSSRWVACGGEARTVLCFSGLCYPSVVRMWLFLVHQRFPIRAGCTREIRDVDSDGVSVADDFATGRHQARGRLGAERGHPVCHATQPQTTVHLLCVVRRARRER